MDGAVRVKNPSHTRSMARGGHVEPRVSGIIDWRRGDATSVTTTEEEELEKFSHLLHKNWKG